MSRAGSLLGVVVAASAFAGCGGPSPYCAAVEQQQASIESFGAKRTDAGYTAYAKALTTVAKQAPASVKKQWTQLADVTTGVVKAQQDAGIKLEDMDDEQAREGLDEAAVDQLNTAYEAFNDTQTARKAVVADVEKTCDIKLK